MDKAEPTRSGVQIALATAPVNWNNFDLPNWRTAVPFPAILDEMHAAGYTLTEWDQSFGNNSESLLEEAQARDIAYCGAYRWFDFQDDQQFQANLKAFLPAAAVLQELGVTNLIVADRLRPDRVAIAGRAFRSPERALPENGFQAIARNCLALASAVAPHGLRVHYHNHVGTAVESPEEVASLVNGLDPSIGICFDTGHFAYGGGDPLAFLQQHAARCTYLHLKDVDPTVVDEARRLEWSFLEALEHIVFPPIGEGDVPFESIADTLLAHQFQGTIVIEQDTCLGDPTAVATGNRQYVANAFGIE